MLASTRQAKSASSGVSLAISASPFRAAAMASGLSVSVRSTAPSAENKALALARRRRWSALLAVNATAAARLILVAVFSFFVVFLAAALRVLLIFSFPHLGRAPGRSGVSAVTKLTQVTLLNQVGVCLKSSLLDKFKLVRHATRAMSTIGKRDDLARRAMIAHLKSGGSVTATSDVVKRNGLVYVVVRDAAGAALAVYRAQAKQLRKMRRPPEDVTATS
jgi:hypothetical protein